MAGFWVDAFNYCKPSLSNKHHDADRPQQPRRVVDQKKKRRKAKYSKARSHKQNKLKNGVLNPVDRAYCEEECKDEKSGRVPDDVVSQQDGGNNSRSQLSACNLQGNKQRSEREDHETQRCGDQRVEHRLRARNAEAQKRPAKPSVSAVQYARYGELKRNCNEGTTQSEV